MLLCIGGDVLVCLEYSSKHSLDLDIAYYVVCYSIDFDYITVVLIV